MDKPARNDLHPTMKPVALVERAIRTPSRSWDIVLEPFGGSGSTLIACEKAGRQARLAELDPKYCDVIVRRWQACRGGAATLDGTGESYEEMSDRGEAPGGQARRPRPDRPSLRGSPPASSGGLGPSASGNARRGHLKSRNLRARPESGARATRHVCRTVGASKRSRPGVQPRRRKREHSGSIQSGSVPSRRKRAVLPWGTRPSSS